MSLAAPTLVDPGTLDRLITLLSPLETRDAGGGVVTTFATSGTTWAEYRPTPGRELQEAGQKLGLALATFRVRWRAAITAKWRLLLGSTIFELIAPPVEVGRRFYLDLVCQALDPTNLAINGVGLQAFTLALAQGDTEKAVTYPTAFGSTPATVYVGLNIPGGGYIFDVALRGGTSTPTGFTADLGASVPAAGYSLSIIAVL